MVVGGGAAGIAAAYTAAQQGLDVMLVEKNGFLGGMATAAYVGTICGLYQRSEDDIFEYAAAGFTRKFAEQLMHRSNSQPVRGQKGLKFLPYDRLAFMSLADDLLIKQHVRTMLHTTLIGATAVDGIIEQVKINQTGEQYTIQANHFVDTSGLAIFSAFIDSIDLIESNRYQAGALVFGLTGIDVDHELQLNLHLIKTIKSGIESGVLVDDKSWVSAVPGSHRNKSAYFKLSIPFSLYGSINSLANAERYARLRIQEFVNYLKANNSVFKNINITMVAPSVGMRTGPRYRGDYVLTQSDVLDCRKIEVSVAKGVWPIEYWEPGEKVAMTYFEPNDYYDIPSSCLTTGKVKNLHFAGRHISAEESAIASARVIGTCMQMGESLGLLLNNSKS